MRTVIIRNPDCNYKFNIVTLIKRDCNTFIESVIKESISLKEAQAYFGVDDTATLRDSEGDRI